MRLLAQQVIEGEGNRPSAEAEISASSAASLASGAIGGLAPSAELAGSAPGNPLVDHDLGMLAIANVAAEDSQATLPAHRLASTPGRAYPAWRRSCTQLVALARLPWLASG
jgi:hypothetical protein